MSRTFFKSAVTLAALFNPSANTTFSALTTLESTSYSLAVPRQFSPYRPTFILFTTGLPNGVFVSSVTVTGNDPSSGASPAVYSANFSLYNSTSGTLTPTAQQVIIFQI